MHRILVEEKRWISESRFPARAQLLHAAAGPRGAAACDLYRLADASHARRHHGRRAVRLSRHHLHHGAQLRLCRLGQRADRSSALFFGLKAAVLAIVLEAVFRIGKRSLKNSAMHRARGGRIRRHFLFQRSVSDHRLRRGVHRLCRRLDRRHGISSQRRPWQRQARTQASSTACSASKLPEHARPTVARALRASSVWLALWLIPVIALLATLGSGNVFSQIAVFFSKMAMVTFGGAYAVLAYVAQQAVENYGWLKPGEMLDGLGMAETTPGPLIMVLQFVGFMAAFRDPGDAFADAGRNARRPARDLGHLHALLSVDFPRRAVRREAARQQGAQWRLVGDHRRGGRGDLEPRDLVRASTRSSAKPCRCARFRSRSTHRFWRASTGGRWRFRSPRPSPSSASRSGMIQTLAACCAVGLVLYLAGALA